MRCVHAIMLVVSRLAAILLIDKRRQSRAPLSTMQIFKLLIPGFVFRHGMLHLRIRQVSTVSVYTSRCSGQAGQVLWPGVRLDGNVLRVGRR